MRDALPLCLFNSSKKSSPRDTGARRIFIPQKYALTKISKVKHLDTRVVGPPSNSGDFFTGRKIRHKLTNNVFSHGFYAKPRGFLSGVRWIG